MDDGTRSKKWSEGDHIFFWTKLYGFLLKTTNCNYEEKQGGHQSQEDTFSGDPACSTSSLIVIAGRRLERDRFGGREWWGDVQQRAQVGIKLEW